MPDDNMPDNQWQAGAAPPADIPPVEVPPKGEEPIEPSPAEQQPAAPPQPPAQPVDWHSQPEVQEFVAQQAWAEQQRQTQVAEVMRQAQMREAQAREAVIAAQYQAEVAGKDDYEKAQITARYQAGIAAQQTAQAQQEVAYYRNLAQIDQDKRTWIQGRVAAFNAQFKDVGLSLPPDAVTRLADTQSPVEVEVRLAAYVRQETDKRAKAIKEDSRRREGTDNVDVGAGAPSATGDFQRNWERARRDDNLADGIGLLLGGKRR